jgi:pimeloyl-ACP methyl ester carboxylesterase
MGGSQQPARSQPPMSDMATVPSVVLLHGLLNDSTLWSEQRSALGVDFAPITPEFSAAGSLAVLAAEVLAHAPRRFALAGFSMGGYVALEVLRQAPERIEGIALLASTALADSPAQCAARLATIAAVEAGKFSQLVAAIARSAVFPAGAHAETARGRFMAMAHRVGPQKFTQHLRAVMERQGQVEVLSAAPCPAIVIAGANDSVVPPEAASATAAALPHAPLAMVERAGHLLPLEAPSRVSQLLRGWLERVHPTATC